MSMSIYGLSAEEILILERWCTHHSLFVATLNGDDLFGDIRHRREQWLEAGGSLPVTEGEALFLKPWGRADG